MTTPLLLPLYEEAPRLAVEREPEALPLDSQCDRCRLGRGVKTRCMAAEGEPGGLLVVSDYPGRSEDAAGRPFYGRSGRMLRSEVTRLWRGPLALDNAIRCAPGSTKVTASHISKCRAYLARTIEEVKPTRIVAAGACAIASFVGKPIPPLSVRRGYTTTSSGVPVFLMMNPAAALRNRFVAQWFKQDLCWALSVETRQLGEPVWLDSWAWVVRTVEDADAALRKAREVGAVAYDAETAGRHWETGNGEPESDGFVEPRFRVLCCGVAPLHSPLVWVWDEAALRDELLFARLKELLEDGSISKIGQNEKFDRHCMGELGIEVAGYDFDTRLVRRILNPEASAKLEVMQFLVGVGGGKDEMKAALSLAARRARKKPTCDLSRAVARGHTSHERYSYGLVDRELLHRYNALDALSTARLGVMLRQRMDEAPKALGAVWEKLVLPFSLAVAQIERWGVAVSREAIESFQTVVLLESQEARARINTTAVGAGLVDFNPGSPKQLSDLLYGRLGLSPTKLTPTGSPSTDKESLLELERQHPVVGDVLKWRAMSKLHSTYAQPLPGFVRSDGRIHPSVRIDGARSGRPSCSEPNLYNVPRATDDLSRFARDCFVAPPGSVLVSFDYKQLELYVAAIESGDEVMIEMLRSGEDFHLSTARLISRQLWGIAPEDVPEKGAERSAAKAVNFGLLYGMGTGTLAHRLGVSYQRAEETVRAIMGQFKQLDRYRRELIVRARRTGEAWTRWNGEPFRCRPLWRIADVDSEVRSRAENASLNTPIQAFASDFCEFSIVEVVRWLLRTGFPAKLVLSVYDSIMLEVGEARAAELVDEVGEIMTSWPTGYDGFRLRVDVEVGESWGSLEPWEKTSAGA